MGRIHISGCTKCTTRMVALMLTRKEDDVSQSVINHCGRTHNWSIDEVTSFHILKISKRLHW